MSLNRRRLLGLSAGALLGLSGCAAADPSGGGDGGSDNGDTGSRGARERAFCVPRAELSRQSTVGGLPLVYEISRRRSAFWFDTDFHDQLDTWLDRFVTDAKPSTRPTEVWSYGAWIDGGTTCGSWHNSGRAFDLARLQSGGRDLVSCRYDLWRNAADAVDQRRRYWAVAAGLHHDFAYVLTYLYNDQHYNHIHIDNGRSGSGLSTLSTRSRVQVQAVQAMINYLWDVPLEISGRWDAATRRASRTVLDRIEIDADLTSSAETWRAFLRAGTARFPAQ